MYKFIYLSVYSEETVAQRGRMMAQSQEVVILASFNCPVITKVNSGKMTDFAFLGFHSTRTLNSISYSQTGAHIRTPGELLEMLISGSPLEFLIEKI